MLSRIFICSDWIHFLISAYLVISFDETSMTRYSVRDRQTVESVIILLTDELTYHSHPNRH